MNRSHLPTLFFATSATLSVACGLGQDETPITPVGSGDESCMNGSCNGSPSAGPAFSGGGVSGTATVGFDGGTFVDPTLRPAFGPIVTASTPPPPISGGTLIVLHDGVTAVASDPDRDAVYVVNVQSSTVTHTVSLQPGDEPGRLVEDGAGRVHVALRSAGALVTIDPALGMVTDRRTVCPAPRGVAWDSTTDGVWVACATAELVSLPAAGGAATTRWAFERDLRDVIVNNGSLSVTEFRSAQLLRIAGANTIARRDVMPQQGPFEPHVAWRAVEGPSGIVVVAHQEHSMQNIQTGFPGGYGQGPQSGAVGSQCTVVGSDGTVLSTVAIQTVLPVDVAVSPDATFAAVVGAGDSFASGLGALTIVPLDLSANAGGVDVIPTSPVAFGPDAGFVGIPTPVPGPFMAVGPAVHLPTGSQAIAVAFDGKGNVLVQTREPAALWVIPIPASGATTTAPWATPGAGIGLSSVSRDDTGHDIFHASAGALIACASCHPEGGDDGHVWMLDGNQRRTPSLRGTIAGTAPYHWPGDEPDLTTLTTDVYNTRMSGQPLDLGQMTALASWIQAIPAPPPPSWVDLAAATRGRSLFTRGDVACATCHSGPKLTNNLTLDVGTGQAFQVPPLVGVGWRTPLLHDGRAATVADRFVNGNSQAHGNISGLTAPNINDLTAYLDTL